MSSILDALRKLEQEKTERGEVLSTAVAGDILRNSACRHQRRWLLPTLIIAIILLLAAALFLIWRPQPAALPLASTAVATTGDAPAAAVPASSPSVHQAPVLPSDLPILSGIVYQARRDARIAILNDLPTMEDAEVAGYRLREIRPDRVLLERDGRSYELPLSAER